MHEPSDEASAAAAYLEVWRRLLVPLSRGRLACTRGRQTATLAFELPAEPEALPAGAQLQYASFELRREGPAGLEDVCSSDGGVLGTLFSDDAAPARADRRLDQVAARWTTLVQQRLEAWLEGSLDPMSVFVAGLYDAGVRCVTEPEPPALERPLAPELPRGREAARRLVMVPPDVGGAVWAATVEGWRLSGRPDVSPLHPSALLLRSPEGEQVPVVVDDGIDLVQGPGLPEPHLRALLTWLHRALVPSGLGSDADWVLFRDRYRRFEPLDWASDPGIVAREPFGPTETAAAARRLSERFLSEVLGGRRARRG